MRAFLAAMLLLVLGCASIASADTASDHYFWRPSNVGAGAHPWVILLPGSSGMNILGDDQHYFRAAQWLNERGLDALIIDYKSAAHLIPAARDGEAGDRIAVVVADAIAAERQLGRMSSACPGAVIGWSLGAEGAWALAASSTRDAALKAVAVFYPTVRRPASYRNTLPVLVLQGEADNVTPLSETRAFVAARSGDSAPVQVLTFANAGHGFDVQSLTPPRTVQFPPLIGPRVTFAYSADAAASAYAALAEFLNDQNIVCASASG